MDDKFKIIITDDNGKVSVDVITGEDWLTVTESDLTKQKGLSMFGLCKTLVSVLKKQLQESK